MSALIEHIIEPKRLILAWEPPPGVADRSRWAVGEILPTPRGLAFRYYRDAEFTRLNKGRAESELAQQGYAGYPAFDPKEHRNFYYSRVLDAFMRRVPTSARSDFHSYLRHFGISPTASGLTPLSLLALTEARLPGDWFSLVDPLDPADEFGDFNIEVTGHRSYYFNALADGIGTSISFVAEPSNPVDKNAVQVQASGSTIGYVNRLQAETFTVWLATRSLWGVVSRTSNSGPGRKIFATVKVRPLGSVIRANALTKFEHQQPTTLRNYLTR